MNFLFKKIADPDKPQCPDGHGVQCSDCYGPDEPCHRNMADPDFAEPCLVCGGDGILADSEDLFLDTLFFKCWNCHGTGTAERHDVRL